MRVSGCCAVPPGRYRGATIRSGLTDGRQNKQRRSGKGAAAVLGANYSEITVWMGLDGLE